ncbi:unnamed protein product [Callosobruchus maculatus]
MVVWQ